MAQLREFLLLPGQMFDQQAGGVQTVVAPAQGPIEVMPADFRAEQSAGLAHPRPEKGVAATFRQRFGPELPGRLHDVVGKLQVVYERFPQKPAAQAMQQDPDGFLGAQDDAVAIDQREAVAVAVEGDAQMGTLAVHRFTQVGQLA